MAATQTTASDSGTPHQALESADPPLTVSAPTLISPATPSFSPLYQQIKALLLQSLEAGEWKSGAAIPSEQELAARFKVSQGTVRKAIDELAIDNLLVRRQGKGTFVATHAERQVQYRFLKLVPKEGEASSDAPVQREIIDCKRSRASVEIARGLSLRPGDAVLQVRRVLSFGATPTILEDIWLPGIPFKGLSAERLRNDSGPMYALFEREFGVRMVRAEEKIRAVLPDPTQAVLLGVAPSTPLLSVERIALTYNDAPMEMRQCLYRTDAHYYRNELH